jgi:hypothetical protein
MKTLPGIPEVTEEMTFPENDQQMASQVVTCDTIKFKEQKYT